MKIIPASLIWDDPLLGIAWNELPGHTPQIVETLLNEYSKIKKLTQMRRKDQNAGHIDYAWNLANVLYLKLMLRKKLVLAYQSHDFNTLKTIADKNIPVLLDALEALLAAFRTQWKRSFKPFGMELMQIRIGGLKERYRELSRTIRELIRGESNSIPALDIKHKPLGDIPITYHELATGGFFI